MTTMHEYASPGWMDLLCEIVEDHLAGSGVDLTGISYVFGEEFIGVPDRLNPMGAHRVGWHVRIREGVVSSATVPPPADADSNNIADWEATETLCHSVVDVTDLPAAMALMETVADLEAKGQLERVRRSERPDLLVQVLDTPDIHNAIGARTSRRPALA